MDRHWISSRSLGASGGRDVIGALRTSAARHYMSLPSSDGWRVQRQCPAVRAHALPVHGSVYLVMAALVVAYEAGALPIGEYGWAMLGAITIVGTVVLWWGSERIWGLFWHR